MEEKIDLSSAHLMPNREDRNFDTVYDYSGLTKRNIISQTEEEKKRREALAYVFAQEYEVLKTALARETLNEVKHFSSMVVSSQKSEKKAANTFLNDLRKEILLLQKQNDNLETVHKVCSTEALEVVETRIKDLCQSFSKRLREESDFKLKQYFRDAQDMEKHRCVMENLLALSKDNIRIKLKELSTDHEFLLQEIKNKSAEQANMCTMTIQSDLSEIKKALQDVDENYLESNQQKLEDFKFLLKKDEELSQEIQIKMDYIEVKQKLLLGWKEKLAKLIKTSKDQISSLQLEKETRRNEFFATKVKLKELRKLARSNQRKYSKKHELEVNILNEAIGFGERTQHFLKLCGSKRKTLSSDLRVNLYLLHATTQFKRAKEENLSLRCAIKDIEMGTSVPTDIMDTTNPLVVIKGNVILGELQKQRNQNIAHPSIIDGNAVFRNLSRCSG